MLKCVVFVEGYRVELDGRRRCEDASRTAVVARLNTFIVRSRIRSCPEATIARSHMLPDLCTMRFVLRHWLAVIARVHSTTEHCVAIDHQVMSRHCSMDVVIHLSNEISRTTIREMFEDYGQSWEGLGDGLEVAVDRNDLTIEFIDIFLDCFKVSEQRDFVFLHCFKHRIATEEIFHTVRRAGSSSLTFLICHVELYRTPDTFFETAHDFFGIDVIRQVQRHAWHEVGAVEECRNPVTIFPSFLDRGDRVCQVGHDDRSRRTLLECTRKDRFHHFAIANVEVAIKPPWDCH